MLYADENLIKVNSRAAGMLSIALNTGKLLKNSSDAVNIPTRTTRTTRHRNSKVQEQAQALLLAHKSAQAKSTVKAPTSKSSDKGKTH